LGTGDRLPVQRHQDRGADIHPRVASVQDGDVGSLMPNMQEMQGA
jgi:hypothetical protein